VLAELFIQRCFCLFNALDRLLIKLPQGATSAIFVLKLHVICHLQSYKWNWSKPTKEPVLSIASPQVTLNCWSKHLQYFIL